MTSLIPEPDDPQAEIDRLRAEQKVLLGALKEIRKRVPTYEWLAISDLLDVKKFFREEIDPIIKSFEEPQ